jgi:hypothetical protein
MFTQVTLAERSKTCIVFVCSEAGIVGSNHTQGLNVWCVRFLCVCVVLCIGRGLPRSWSPVQGVLPCVKWSRNWEISPMLQSGSKRKKKICSRSFSLSSLNWRLTSAFLDRNIFLSAQFSGTLLYLRDHVPYQYKTSEIVALYCLS